MLKVVIGTLLSLLFFVTFFVMNTYRVGFVYTFVGTVLTIIGVAIATGIVISVVDSLKTLGVF